MEILTSLATLASVAVLIYQIHLLKKEVRVNTYFRLIEEASTINRVFIEYPSTSKLLAGAGYVEDGGDKSIRAQWLAITILDFFENLYYAYCNGVIPESLGKAEKA